MESNRNSHLLALIENLEASSFPKGAHLSKQVSSELYDSHYKLAKIYFDKSDLTKAREHFLICIDLCPLSTKEKSFQNFKVLGFLVRIASEMLDPINAELYTKQSEELLSLMRKAEKNPRGEFFYNEANVATYRGRFLEARESFSKAYKLAQSEQNAELCSKSLHSLANNYILTKDYTLALKTLGQLSDILQILDRTYLIGSMHLLMGNVLLELGRYSEALNYYKLAKRGLLAKTCWNLFPYLLLGEGVIYKKMGEFSKALFFLDYALDSVDGKIFRRAANFLNSEIAEIKDSAVDLYLDKTKRIVMEKNKGLIDFKHRFILLEILFLLAQNPGVTFSKEDLAQNIWQHEYNPLIHDKLIYTSVSRLRKLLEPKGEKRTYIIRVKDGYIFSTEARVRFQKESEFGVYRPSIANIELSSPI